MANQITVVDAWNNLLENGSDPRVKDWFMMSGFLPTLCIIVVYVFVVKILGPSLMKKREPFALKNIMLVYNFAQVFISIYLFSEIGGAGWFGKYSFRCQPVDYSNSLDGLRMAWACYLYYLSKFTELADTVFFMLRKKNNQITTLHVIHHGIMPMTLWFGVKFLPGGHGTFFILLNTFVHIWMYLYYFLAALGPRIQPYLWWKKYLTSMQIIQFIMILVHGLQMFFIECDYSMICVWSILFHAVLFLFMFRDFYNKSYKPKGAKKSEFNVDGFKGDSHRNLVNKRRGSAVKQD